MKLNYTKLALTAVFIIPAMSFATEKVKATPKDNAGYYNLNVGYYDKPQLSGYLPKKGEATIETKQNAVFSITLPASPSTGYSWGLRTLPSQLMFLNSSYQQSGDCNGLGCGGETTYTFKALKPGTGKVEFHYGQQWENDSADIRIININVK